MMNLDELEKFFSGAKNIKLDEKKKSSINWEVLSFIKKHPFTKENRQNNKWFIFSIFNFKVVKTVFALFVLLLLIMGATTGAESAIPGDMLYPLKLGFNEKVMEVLAFSDEQKVDLSMQLIERRLQESEQLIVQNKINAVNKAELNSSFAAEAKKASKNIDNLSQKKKDSSSMEASSNFESLLKAHSRILKNLENNENKGIINSLITDVEKKVQDASYVKNITQNNVIDDNDEDTAKEKTAQDKLKSAEEEISKVRAIIKKKKNKIGDKAAIQAENNLNAAEQKISKGREHINFKFYNNASFLFEDAKGVAKETKHLIKAKDKLRADFDIEINGNNSKEDDSISK